MFNPMGMPTLDWVLEITVTSKMSLSTTAATLS